MTLLVINCGTSSVKITLFDHNLEKIEEKNCTGSFALTMIENYHDIQAIGHRVVHGGIKYHEPTLITEEVEKDLWDLCEIAPLHNPPSLEAIDLCRKLFPQTPQWAFFDTAFHSKKPPKAAFYALPWNLSQKYGLRRYGFHGLAHAFSFEKYNKPKAKAITVHLGSGSSITAIKEGISIDTSMGFTPLDGIMMATRSGELDPSAVAFLCDKEKKTPDEIISLLNHEAGMMGVFGQHIDIKELFEKKEPQAKLATDMFIYQIQKKIGAYLAILEGVDALIFSGGIGENSAWARRQIAQSFKWAGLFLDEAKNQALHIKSDEIKCISQEDSRIGVYVVGSDENLYIANFLTSLLLRGY